jgi:hypothetical protein
MEAALELAQVCVRDLGPSRKLAKREPRELALGVDELAERLDLLLPGVVQLTFAFGADLPFPPEGRSTGAAASRMLSANSRCAFKS